MLDKATCIVRITGPDKESVAKARAIMEYTILRLPLKASEVAGVIGRDGATIDKIREDSGVIKLLIEPVSLSPRYGFSHDFALPALPALLPWLLAVPCDVFSSSVRSPRRVAHVAF